MTIPTMYSFVWMAIFGGVGIKMERQAFLNNITCDSALGGATSTQADNGLFRLSCRYECTASQKENVSSASVQDPCEFFPSKTQQQSRFNHHEKNLEDLCVTRVRGSLVNSAKNVLDIRFVDAHSCLWIHFRTDVIFTNQCSITSVHMTHASTEQTHSLFFDTQNLASETSRMWSTHSMFTLYFNVLQDNKRHVV